MSIKKLTATVLAVLIMLTFVSCGGANVSDNGADTDNQNENPAFEDKAKTYAADSLLTNGKFGSDEDGELTIGFIGGSLTAINAGMCYFDAVGEQMSCGNSWGLDVCNYCQEKFPNKTVKGVNAGIGGTGSDYGALRFEKFILEYEPDIVFIDYAVNDSGRDKEESQKYMERMLNMCRNADKVPVVIFLYMPYPADKDSDTVTRWKNGVDAKSEIADYYGIGDINIYDFLYKTFEESEYDNLTDFLDLYYSGGANGFDVHGGYDLYFGSIVEALENNPEDYIKRIGNPESLKYSIGDCTYNLIAPTDERLKYEGNWTLYTRENIYSHPDGTIEPYDLEYPFAVDGVIDSTTEGDTVTFTTDAAELCFLTIFSEWGGIGKVTVDGEYAGDVVTASIYNTMANVFNIELPDDGNTHEVKVTVTASDGGCAFRIGYIGEIIHTEK